MIEPQTIDLASAISTHCFPLPTLNLLEASRQELMEREYNMSLPGTGWGYFPDLKNNEPENYPESFRLGTALSEALLSNHTLEWAPTQQIGQCSVENATRFRLSFIKQSQSEITASFGGLHLDPDLTLQDNEEIERLLINLHTHPRQLRIALTNRHQMSASGVRTDRHKYTVLNLPTSIPTTVMEIPPRTSTRMYAVSFLSSLIPHVGVTGSDGHFLASFERKVRLLKKPLAIIG